MMGNIGCLCEACWKGYEKKGMKKMFGKMYPNCVKKENTQRKMSSLEMQQIILLAKAMKQMPGSPAQKKIKQQINVIRKKLGQKPVKEIFPKGAGRKISKAMQKTIEPQGNIKKVLDVAKNKQAKKIGGTLVDGTTANMMTQVWDKVNDSSKEKMNKMNTKQLTNLILKFWKAVGTPRI